MRLDRYGQLKPSGASGWFAGRSLDFAITCPFSPNADNEDDLAAARFPMAPHIDTWIGRFEAAYVGHVEESDFRRNGSSGGMASWTAVELLRSGLVDAIAHVVSTPSADADGRRFFRYGISRSEAEIRAGAKSRYYPIELTGVIDAIRATPGRYAVVGVPCYIKAIHLLCAQEPVLRDRIAFTLGLFCGHMKSARMVESFVWQMGARIEAIDAIEFRAKDPSRPANWYTARIGLKNGAERRQDWWQFVDGDWGAGFFQNSACDYCDDVVAETADISFGDAWIEPYSSDGRGTNVIVVRSSVLDHLVRAAINAGHLKLVEVDAEFVRQTQAAGIRQRREGLSYRLSRRRWGLRPSKRVGATAPELSRRRRMIYILRSRIAAWSHRIFLLAKLTRTPGVYIHWTRIVLAIYQGFAYSQGWIGVFVDRAEALIRSLLNRHRKAMKRSG
jgi:coenzyme F420-reducing hydrogenase beta subunit